MYKIEAIVREENFEDVRAALEAIEVHGLTVFQVMGCGVQKGSTEVVRGQKVDMMVLPTSNSKSSFPTATGPTKPSTPSAPPPTPATSATAKSSSPPWTTSSASEREKQERMPSTKNKKAVVQPSKKGWKICMHIFQPFLLFGVHMSYNIHTSRTLTPFLHSFNIK